MDEMGIYVIRLYRGDAGGLAGTVEAVASGTRIRFRSAEDLWQAIHALASIPWRPHGTQPEEDDLK